MRTPRNRAIERAIFLIELDVANHLSELPESSDKAVLRHMRKLTNQLRRKIGADEIEEKVA